MNAAWQNLVDYLKAFANRPDPVAWTLLLAWLVAGVLLFWLNRLDRMRALGQRMRDTQEAVRLTMAALPPGTQPPERLPVAADLAMGKGSHGGQFAIFVWMASGFVVLYLLMMNFTAERAARERRGEMRAKNRNDLHRLAFQEQRADMLAKQAGYPLIDPLARSDFLQRAADLPKGIVELRGGDKEPGLEQWYLALGELLLEAGYSRPPMESVHWRKTDFSNARNPRVLDLEKEGAAPHVEPLVKALMETGIIEANEPHAILTGDVTLRLEILRMVPPGYMELPDVNTPGETRRRTMRRR